MNDIMNENMSNNLLFEKNPIIMCISYLLFVFAMNIIITDNVIAAIASDILLYIFMLYRRKKCPYNYDVTPMQITRYDIFLIFCVFISCYLWSKWYVNSIDDVATQSYMSTVSHINKPLYLLSISIFAPFGEEAVFRYFMINGGRYMFRKCDPRLKCIFSISLSAFLFGLIHGTGVHLLIGFLCGLLLGYIYYITNQLRYSIVLHSLYNLCTMVVWVPLSLSLCLLFTVTSLVLLWKGLNKIPK